MPGPGTSGFDAVVQLRLGDFEDIFAGVIRAAASAAGTTGIVLVNGHQLLFDPSQIDVALLASRSTGLDAQASLALGQASYDAGGGAIDLGDTFFDFVVRFGVDNGRLSVQPAPSPRPALRPYRNAVELDRRVGLSVAGTAVMDTIAATGIFPQFVPPMPLPVGALGVGILRSAAGSGTPNSVAIGVSGPLSPSPDAGGLARLAPNVPVGTDGTVTLSNSSLFTALRGPLETAMGLSPGDLVPSVGGLTQRAPALPGNVGGTPVVWGVPPAPRFALAPPGPGGTAITMAGSFDVSLLGFDFRATFITPPTVTVTISNGTVLVVPTVPPPVVTVTPQPGTIVLAGLAGVALLAIAGPVVGTLVAALIAALVAALVAAISAAIAASASSAIAGAAAGAGLGLGGLLSGLNITGVVPTWPVFLDDLVMASLFRRADAVATRATSPATELRPAWGLDLDAGRVVPVTGVGFEADLFWDESLGVGLGLRADRGARMVRITRPYDVVSHADLRSMVVGASHVFPAADVPVIRAGVPLPPPLVLGIRTNLMRYAKIAAWRDGLGRLVVRYLCYDTPRPSLRIATWTPLWRRTETVQDRDTPATYTEPARRNYRHAHEGSFLAVTHRLVHPVTYRWTLDGRLIDGSGTVSLGGTPVSYAVSRESCTLRTGVGISVSAVLACTVSDATGGAVSDHRRLEVGGRRSEPFGTTGMQIEWEARERADILLITPEFRWVHGGDPPPLWADDRWALAIDQAALAERI